MDNDGGSDLRSLRLARGLRQQDVARTAGASTHELRKWERGLERPERGILERLACVLGRPVAEIEAAQDELLKRATPGEGYTTARVDKTCVFPRAQEPPSSRVRVLDLFCGSGGFSYGFEQTGHFAITAGIDLLPDRIETFRRNHPYANAILADILRFQIDRLTAEALDPEIVIGGPPCQGFSSIRPFRTLTEGDPRNSLVEYFALVVMRIRPRWFVLENVVGLLTHGGGEVLPRALAAFEAAGYRTDWMVLNAANYGLPQNRERLVIVGNRAGLPFDWPAPTHFSDHRSMAGKSARRSLATPLFNRALRPALTVMEAIHDLPEIRAGESATKYRENVVPTDYERLLRGHVTELTLHEATAHTPRMLEIIRLAGSNRSALPPGLTSSGFSSCYSRLEPDRPSVTLTVNFVHPASNKCIHPYQDRALTPREGARIQGFPDYFDFSGNRAQVVKQIGNAVPPFLGRVLGEALASTMGLTSRREIDIPCRVAL